MNDDLNPETEARVTAAFAELTDRHTETVHTGVAYQQVIEGAGSRRPKFVWPTLGVVTAAATCVALVFGLGGDDQVTVQTPVTPSTTQTTIEVIVPTTVGNAPTTAQPAIVGTQPPAPAPTETTLVPASSSAPTTVAVTEAPATTSAPTTTAAPTTTVPPTTTEPPQPPAGFFASPEEALAAEFASTAADYIGDCGDRAGTDLGPSTICSKAAGTGPDGLIDYIVGVTIEMDAPTSGGGLYRFQRSDGFWKLVDSQAVDVVKCDAAGECYDAPWGGRIPSILDYFRQAYGDPAIDWCATTGGANPCVTPVADQYPDAEGQFTVQLNTTVDDGTAKVEKVSFARDGDFWLVVTFAS